MVLTIGRTISKKTSDLGVYSKLEALLYGMWRCPVVPHKKKQLLPLLGYYGKQSRGACDFVYFCGFFLD